MGLEVVEWPDLELEVVERRVEAPALLVCRLGLGATCGRPVWGLPSRWLGSARPLQLVGLHGRAEEGCRILHARA